MIEPRTDQPARSTSPSREAGAKRPQIAILAVATLVTAVLAVATALIYVGAGSEPLSWGAIYATIFGVGGSVILAGVLMTLIFYSDESGYDDHMGG